jgi:DNA-binding transcriptional MerR regulator
MPSGPPKASGAFRTIGEVSEDTGLPQHILRYWETRFPQLRPVTRAGNRRYYRPADVDLVRRIDGLLNRDGYTIRGVQQLLADDRPSRDATDAAPYDTPAALRKIRDRLAQALDRDDDAA